MALGPPPHDNRRPGRNPSAGAGHRLVRLHLLRLAPAGFQRQAEGFRREARQKESEILEKESQLTDTKLKSRDLAVEASSFFAVGTALMRRPFSRQLQTAAPLVFRSPDDALALLEDEQRCPANLRDFTWRFLHRHALFPQQLIPVHSKVSAIQFDADGQSLAMIDPTGHWSVWRQDESKHWRHEREGALATLAVRANQRTDGDTSAFAFRPSDLAVVEAVGKQLMLHPMPGSTATDFLPDLSLPGHVRCLRFDASSRYLVCICEDDNPPDDARFLRVLIDLNVPQIIASDELGADAVVSIDFVVEPDSPDGPPATLLCRARGQLQQWPLAPAHRRQLSLSTSDAATAVATCQARQAIACGETIRLFDDNQPPIDLRLLDGRAEHLAFSPTGSQLAAMNDRGILQIWQLETQRADWSAFVDGGQCLQFSHDAQLVALANAQAIRLFESETGQESEPIIVNGKLVDLGWASTSSRLAFVQEDGSAHVIDLSPRRLQLDVVPTGHYTTVRFGSDEELYLGTDEGDLIRWSIATRQPQRVARFEQPIEAIAVCRASPGFVAVASGNRLHAIRPDGTTVAMDAHQATVKRITISRSGESVFSLSTDRALVRSRPNWSTGRIQSAPLDARPALTTTAEISPDGQTFLTLGSDEIQLWDGRDGSFRARVAAGGTVRVARFAPRPFEGTYRLAIYRDDGRLEMWAGDPSPTQSTAYLGGVTRDLVWLKDPTRLLAIGDAAQLVLMEPNDPEDRRTVRVASPLRRAFVLGGSPTRVITLPWDGPALIHVVRTQEIDLAFESTTTAPPEARLELVAATAGGVVWALDPDLDALYRLNPANWNWEPVPAPPLGNATALAAEANRIWIGTDGGEILLLTESDSVWKRQQRVTGHQGRILALQPLPQGGVASIGEDERCAVWETKLQTPLAEATQAGLTHVAVDPEGTCFALASGNEIQLWRLDQGEFRRDGQPLADHTGRIVHLSFSPDGKQLVTTAADRALKFWAVNRNTHASEGQRDAKREGEAPAEPLDR